MKTLILFFIVSTIAISCNNDSPFSEFEGAWEGSYSGNDTGDWMVTIDSDGNVDGTATSDSLPNFPFHLNGQINENGEISAQANVVIGTIEFVGLLNNNTASGSWTNIVAGLQGSWIGEKN